MGGEYQEVVVELDEKAVRKRYAEIHAQAEYDHGHAGYSGSFAEKGDLEIVEGKWTEEDAAKDCDKRNDTYGPAFAYRLWNGSWYIGGWCSS